MRVKGKIAEDSKLELHNPAEISGFPPSNRSKEAEEVRNAQKRVAYSTLPSVYAVFGTAELHE